MQLNKVADSLHPLVQLQIFPEPNIVFPHQYYLPHKNATHVEDTKTHRNKLTVTDSLVGRVELELEVLRRMIVVDGLSLFARSKREENRADGGVVIGDVIQVVQIGEGENGASSAAHLARGVVALHDHFGGDEDEEAEGPIGDAEAQDIADGICTLGIFLGFMRREDENEECSTRIRFISNFNFHASAIKTQHLEQCSLLKRHLLRGPQLGERQTEDLKVTCSIHVHRILIGCFVYFSHTKICIAGVVPRASYIGISQDMNAKAHVLLSNT
ncbi:hypothetical protein CR513_34570, partial [Mucuna pruriens]